jgi:hypothetical protein
MTARQGCRTEALAAVGKALPLQASDSPREKTAPARGALGPDVGVYAGGQPDMVVTVSQQAAGSYWNSDLEWPISRYSA